MKKCVIIGNGPSLNDVDINMLKGVDTFSFNRAYIAYDDWGFTPTYYGISDKITIESCYDGIEKLLETDVKKMFLLKNEKISTYTPNEKIITFDKASKNVSWLRNKELFGKYTIDTIPNNFDTIPCIRGSVCITAICFLYLLGYDSIALIGMDGSFKKRPDVKRKTNKAMFTEDNDINHFRKDYFGKGVVCSDIELEKALGNSVVGWEDVKTKLSFNNYMRISVCNERSNLINIFEFLPLEEFLKM